jgi:hypothetical protein
MELSQMGSRKLTPKRVDQNRCPARLPPDNPRKLEAPRTDSAEREVKVV